MTTKALFILIAFTSTACVAEMGDEFDDVELSQTEQSLTIAGLAYEKGWGDGYLSPVPDTQYDVVDGLVGWHEGEPIWLGFGWVRTPALKTTAASDNITRSGYTRMKFRGAIPANGTCTLSGTLLVDGATYVEGHGNVITGTAGYGTANADVSLKLMVGGALKDSRSWAAAWDGSGTTTRTKSFDDPISLSGGRAFVATKGAAVDVEITLKTQARAYGNGEARVSLYTFGFYANFETDAVHIDCY